MGKGNRGCVLERPSQGSPDSQVTGGARQRALQKGKEGREARSMGDQRKVKVKGQPYHQKAGKGKVQPCELPAKAGSQEARRK